MGSSQTQPSWRRTLVSGTGLNAAAQIFQLVVNLVLTPFVIHGLGPERFSIFLLISTITIVMSSFDGGIGASAQRYFTIYAGAGNRVALTRLLTTLLALVSCATLLVFPILVLAGPSILAFFKVGNDYHGEALVLLRTLTVLVGVLLARNLFISLLVAYGRFAVTASATIFSYVVYAAGLWLTVKFGWGLRGCAATFLAQQIVATVINIPQALRFIDRREIRFISRAEVKEFWTYAWRVQISSLLSLAMLQKDQLVAAKVLGSHHSGPFGQGANFAGQLRMLPMNALSPLQAVIGGRVGEVGESEALGRITQLQTVWVKGVSAWTAVGIPATWFGLTAWLPTSYAQAADVAAILLIGQFFTLSVAVLLLWCLSLGHAGLDVRYSVVTLGSTIPISFGLWHLWGMNGVVLGTALAQATATIDLYRNARKQLTACPEFFLREVPVLATAAAFATTLALEWAVAPYIHQGPVGIFSCGLVAIPGFVVFALMSFGPAKVWALTRQVLESRGLIKRQPTR